MTKKIQYYVRKFDIIEGKRFYLSVILTYLDLN